MRGEQWPLTRSQVVRTRRQVVRGGVVRAGGGSLVRVRLPSTLVLNRGRHRLSQQTSHESAREP